MSPKMSNGLFEGITLKPRMIVFDLGMFHGPSVKLPTRIVDCTLWPFDCDVYEGHKLHKRFVGLFHFVPVYLTDFPFKAWDGPRF